MDQDQEKKIPEEKKYYSKYGWFVRNPRITILLMLIIVFWGIMSLIRIPKEQAPEVDFGFAIINTAYPGASARDIDELVTRVLEKKIKDLDGMNKLNSTSKNSISTISIEFKPGEDMTKALADLRSKIDQAKPDLPEDALDPSIIEITSSDTPIFNIVLTGNYDGKKLRDYGEDLKSFLETVSKVNEVKISGGKKREFQIIIDPLKLKQYNLTIGQIRGKIVSYNMDQPLGEINIGNFKYGLRYQGKYKTIEEIENIPIGQINAKETRQAILLKEIAQVSDTSEDETDATRYFRKGEKESSDAVVLQVLTRKRAGVFDSDKIIREKTNEYVALNLPKDIEVNFTRESIVDISESYNTVFSSAIQTVVIVFFVILLFMGFREAVITSTIVPLCILIASIFLKSSDQTLNFLTNFSMILAIGMLVDTAVVIVESVHDYIKKGYDESSAAQLTIDEFIAPLAAGNMTTLAVFIPLISLPGVLGKYLSFIPITVTVILIASLFVALVFNSTLCSLFLNKNKIRNSSSESKLRHTINSTIERGELMYKKILIKIIDSRPKRIFLFLGLLVIFILSFFIPAKFDMFPDDDSPYLSITAEKPIGTTKENTNSSIQDIEKVIQGLPEIKSYELVISDNSANFSLQLTRNEDRKEKKERTSLELVDELSSRFKNLIDLDVTIQAAQSGPPSDFPVGFKVISQDRTKLEDAIKVVRDLKNMLNDTEGTIGVNDDIENSPGTFNLKIDTKMTAFDGIEVQAITEIIRTVTDGIKLTTIDNEEEESDLIMKLAIKDAEIINQINRLEVTNNQNQKVQIGKYIKFELNSGLDIIKRKDTKIVFTASSLLKSGYTAEEITNKMLEKIDKYQVPEGVLIENSSENEENKELFLALGQASIIAILIMFLILVTQFNSFPQALLVIISILLGQIGVNTGLYLTDTPRSLAFIIGAIALAGIVVNNAIILIDRMNKLDLNHSENFCIEQIAEASKDRIKPIFLTSITTVAGILPLVSLDKFWAGLGYTIVFGVGLGTFLTLFLTPGMYYQIKKDFRFTLFSIITFFVLLTLTIVLLIILS